MKTPNRTTAVAAAIPLLGACLAFLPASQAAAAPVPVPVGSEPRGVALGQGADFAYVAEAYSDAVTVINTSTNTATATIGVATNPYYLAVDPNGPGVYVPGFASTTVSVIDTTDNSVTSINDASFNDPTGVAVNPDAGRPFAYVVNYSFGSETGSVSVIDTGTNTVAGSVPVGKEPRYVAVSPDGQRGYVSNSGDGTVSVLDLTVTPPVVTTTVSGFQDSAGLAVTPDGSMLYVTNLGDDTVSLMRTSDNTIERSISSGGSDPMQVAFNQAGTTAYVTNTGSGSVVTIDTATQTISQTVPGLNSPWGVAAAPSGAFVYVSEQGANEVTRYSKPTISALNPTQGVSRGGTSVSIAGTELQGSSSVRFGPNPATDFTVEDDEHITATTPAGTPGSTVVTVSNFGMEASTVFEYLTPVTITAESASMTAGGPLPAIGYSAVRTGTSTPVVMSTPPVCGAFTDSSYTTAVTSATAAGNYVTHCSGGIAPPGYNIDSYSDGTLTVTSPTPSPPAPSPPPPSPPAPSPPPPSPSPTPPPAAPTGVKGSATTKAVKATWKSVTGADSYTATVKGKNSKNKQVVKEKNTIGTKVTVKVKLKRKSRVKICVTARNATGASAPTCTKAKVK